MRSTRPREIARPSPVPPYLRVVDPSACANGSKMRACASSLSPIPVSTTSNSRTASPPVTFSARTYRPTSPFSVNLIALESRLSNTCRSRPASPHRSTGTSALHEADQFQALGLGAFGQDFDGALDRLADVEVEHLERELARLDLGEVEDVVDDGQQRVRAGLDRQREVALLDVELAVEQQAAHADDAVHRRADLVGHVRQELALGRDEPSASSRALASSFSIRRRARNSRKMSRWTNASSRASRTVRPTET